VRPGDGAVWLEAYFEHFGWVPIVGTPPKAQASLDTKPKKQNPAVVPSDRLDLVTYVPIRLQTTELLFTIVRFWLKRVLPALLVVVLLVLFYPGVLKLLRTLRRRRWALDSGLPQRIAVAYAELRDHAYDLNIGDVTMTPLEFLKAVTPDTEHRELAWLVTRALWGDLARDLHTDDADAAEDMSRSVLKRLRRSNPALNRVVAFGSRTSLRDPYSEDIPNLWPRMRLVAVGVAVLGLLSLSGCATTTAANTAPPTLPPRLLPSAVSDITFHEEPASEVAFQKAGSASLMSTGRVYSIHEGVDVQGSFQAAAFKPKYSARLKNVREGVLQSIAGRDFQLTRLGSQRIYVAALPGEQIMVWFPPSGAYYELIDARQQFTQSENLFVALLNYQQGGTANLSTTNSGVPPLDPRQGGDFS
jgi:hypothetical protein